MRTLLRFRFTRSLLLHVADLGIGRSSIEERLKVDLAERHAAREPHRGI